MPRLAGDVWNDMILWVNTSNSIYKWEAVTSGEPFIQYRWLTQPLKRTYAHHQHKFLPDREDEAEYVAVTQTPSV